MLPVFSKNACREYNAGYDSELIIDQVGVHLMHVQASWKQSVTSGDGDDLLERLTGPYELER